VLSKLPAAKKEIISQTRPHIAFGATGAYTQCVNALRKKVLFRRFLLKNIYKQKNIK